MTIYEFTVNYTQEDRSFNGEVITVMAKDAFEASHMLQMHAANLGWKNTDIIRAQRITEVDIYDKPPQP